MASGRCNQGAGAQAMPLRAGTGAKGPKGWACEEVMKAEGFVSIPPHFMSPTPVTVSLRGEGWGQRSGSGWGEGLSLPILSPRLFSPFPARGTGLGVRQTGWHPSSATYQLCDSQ